MLNCIRLRIQDCGFFNAHKIRFPDFILMFYYVIADYTKHVIRADKKNRKSNVNNPFQP